MEVDSSIQAIIAALRERTREISKRRRQQVEEDEALLEKEIDGLNSHICCDNRNVNPSWSAKEEIIQLKNDLQRAREARDEYKFQLNSSKNKIKHLEEDLQAVRQNQTKNNTSVIADLCHNNKRESSAYTFSLKPCNGNLNDTFSEEIYNRELKYLHKTNEKCFEEIRQLKAQVGAEQALREKLNNYEEEINNLRKIAEERQEKMMHMQIEFDEKFKNSKRGYAAQISALNDKIEELERVRDSLNIELGAAQEEIRSLQFSLEKPDAAELHNCTEITVSAVTDSQQIARKTSLEKEELLNVNTRRERRGQLQPIENIIEHEHHTFVRLSEQPLMYRQQTSVDEVKALNHGVTRGTKRGQHGGQGSKKGSAASQKQEVKKIKSSDKDDKDLVQNIKNELIDASSSSTRKGTRTRTVINRRKKAIDSSIDACITSNKQNKKMRSKEETDENVDPCALEHSCCSLNGTFGKVKPPEGTSTPAIKLLKKVPDDSRRANRRRNK